MHLNTLIILWPKAYILQYQSDILITLLFFVVEFVEFQISAYG